VESSSYIYVEEALFSRYIYIYEAKELYVAAMLLSRKWRDDRDTDVFLLL